MKNYQQLKKIFKRLSHLTYIHRIMMWDEAVMMPIGAEESRTNAVATLSGLMHKTLTLKKVKALIDDAKQENVSDLWDKANLALMEKEYLKAACVSPKLTEELAISRMASEQAWRKYREQNNWQGFLPYFEKTFRLAKEVAERQAEVFHQDPYDVLIDQFSPGFNQKSIDNVFSGLKKSIPVLLQQIVEKQSTDQIKIPKGPFAIEKQKALGMKAMEALQFDFQHGRLDVSHHPFCSGIQTDVRITTRYREDEFLSSLEGICHETGHALYEQGLPRNWMDQPVGQAGHSMTMHESQSLLVEMQVCRSLAFFQHLAPIAQNLFGQQDALTAENLYKLSTRVKPGFIRVDADEVTYPLHIILRYETEKSLLNGSLSIQDVPAWWDEHMKKYLGITTLGNNKDGVMQDVHWPAGLFGYFPAYTLGRLVGAQFFATFIKLHPDFFDKAKGGDFLLLKKWLNENVHSHASSLPTDDLMKKVTGESLNPEYFISHIKQRYLS